MAKKPSMYDLTESLDVDDLDMGDEDMDDDPTELPEGFADAAADALGTDDDDRIRALYEAILACKE